MQFGARALHPQPRPHRDIHDSQQHMITRRETRHWRLMRVAIFRRYAGRKETRYERVCRLAQRMARVIQKESFISPTGHESAL
jgi:hypothetical protein